MEKVIVILPNQTRTITNKKTAEKKGYVITHNVEVEYLGRTIDECFDPKCAPVVGNIVAGSGPHYYLIESVSKIKYKCCRCNKKATHYIGDNHYCPTCFREEVTTEPIKRTKKKSQRNALCECDSGRKYKHCCGARKSRKPQHIFNSPYADKLNQ